MPALTTATQPLGSSLRTYGAGSSYMASHHHTTSSTKPPTSSAFSSLPLNYRSRSSYDLLTLPRATSYMPSSSLRLSTGSSSSASSGYSSTRDHSTSRTSISSGSYSGSASSSSSTTSTIERSSYGRESVTLTRYNQRKSSLDFNDNTTPISASNGSSQNDDSPLKYCSPSALQTTNYSAYSPSSPSSRRKSSSTGRYSVGRDIENSSANLNSSSSTTTKRPTRLSGLTNLGNTCYMNSVLQALYASDAIREYVQNNQRTQLMSALGRLFDEMSSSSNSVASPSYFRTQFVKLQPKFRSYDQQDAQEFLRYLINGLHDEANLARPRVGTKTGFDTPRDSAEAWSQYKQIDDSPLVDMVAGQLSSTIECTACGHRSICYDPFMDLSLPLPRERDCDIERCLKEFQALEELDYNEKINCENCKRSTKSSKRLSIERAPSILILHLKRFSNDGYKLTQPYLSVNPKLFIKSKVYQLYACVSHHGSSARSGHYTAHCNHDGRWFHFNDEKITEKSGFCPSSNLEDCYILFYVESNCTSRL